LQLRVSRLLLLTDYWRCCFSLVVAHILLSSQENW